MQRSFTFFGLAAAIPLMLSACAGGTGSSAGANEAGGQGFEYGAPQAEVDAILEDLEPITLTFQPAATGENSLGAISALDFKAAVEERSGGKIEIDIVYGQAIASYTETLDALRDGRVDISLHVPPYTPSELPVFNSIMAYSQFGPSSTIVGELATGAMMTELAWGTDAFVEEYDAQDLTILSPMINGGEYYMFCNERNVGVAAEDWPGRSVRAGSIMNEVVISAAGATPVSLEYAESYEALQRSTVDCIYAQFAVAAAYGIPEVAPNISHMTQSAQAGSVTNIRLAGSRWNDLPLAYQQIIFDAEQNDWAGWQHNVISSKHDGVEQANGVNGTIEPLPDDVQEKIIAAQEQAVRTAEDDGTFEPELADTARELADKWTEIARELGYEDIEGELTDMTDWYSQDEVDYLPFASALYEEVYLPHRPS